MTGFVDQLHRKLGHAAPADRRPRLHALEVVSIEIGQQREVDRGIRIVGDQQVEPGAQADAHGHRENGNLFALPFLEELFTAEEAVQAGQGHGVGARIAAAADLDGDAAQIGKCLHQGTELQVAPDEAPPEQGDERERRRAGLDPDAVGRVVSGVVVQIDQRFGLAGADRVEDLPGQGAVGVVEGPEEAAIQVATPGQHPVREARRRERRLDVGDDQQGVDGGLGGLAQPGVDGPEARGLVAVQEGHDDAEPRRVPSRNAHRRGVAEPLEEAHGILGNLRRFRTIEEAEPAHASGSGHSSTPAPSAQSAW